MYVSKVHLRNIRGFRNLSLGLSKPDGSVRLKTLIIGRNGTGKTTLLRALALGLCHPTDAQALLSEPIGGMVSEGASRGEIEIELVERQGEAPPLPVEKVVERFEDKESISEVLVHEGHRGHSYPEPFVCGYGAGRYAVGSETGRTYRIADSVYTLFDDRRTLIDTELTLRRLQDFFGSRRYEATLSALKKTLALSAEDQIRLLKGGGIELSGPSVGRRVRLEAWADGYRVTFSWLLDLFGWAMRANRINDNGFVEGIVLVDEVEQHLHPSMQTEILPRLSELLPEVQIIATTHSPLVALGAAPEELVALRREGEEVVAETSIPDYSGYSAEDMLVDERLFGTGVYSPELNEQLARYHQLVKVPRGNRTESQTEELRRLARTLHSQQLPEVRESYATEEVQRLLERDRL